MARYFLRLSYNGTDFNGWQIQENTPNTVQQVLEEKLTMVLREKIALTGAGRTDTGVNARGYVAHLDCSDKTLHLKKHFWLHKLNTVLPQSIAIHDMIPVNPSAHARFDATQRVYHYYLARRKDPFRMPFSWLVGGELDFDAMNEAAATLIKYHDFTSFSKSNTQNKTNRCLVSRAVWHRSAEYEWRFTISADRFLRGMVRAIVGTLVLVGQKKMTLAGFCQVIETRDRQAAGMNAPARALFLAGISYPDTIYERT